MDSQIVLRVLAWLSCLEFANVGAWDRDGHERIGHVARHILGKPLKHKIEYMMKDSQGRGEWNNLLGMAGWEDYTTRTYIETSKLHYHKQMPEWGCTGRSGMDFPGSTDGTLYCNDAAASFNSLFCAMIHFWNKIEAEGAPSNLTAKIMLKHGTINTLYELPPKDVYTIPSSMRWLFILLGDAHNPLHWLRGETTYGKDIKVDFKGKVMSLLEVWESHILTHPDWKSEDWNAVRSEYDKMDAGWNKTAKTDLLQFWSQEIAKKVCPDIYDELGEPDENGVYIITSRTVLKWIRMGRDLAILAGQRFVHLMTFIHRQVAVRQKRISWEIKEIDRKMNTTTTTFSEFVPITFEPPDLGAIDFQRVLDGKQPLETFVEPDYHYLDPKYYPTKDDKIFDYDKFKANKPQQPHETLVQDQAAAQRDWEHPEFLHPRVEV